MSDNHFLEFLKSLNILYVEDEENIRNNITKTLKLICHNVYSAENGLEAFKIYSESHIDIILSDISMPKMNGLELASKIRELNKKIPIILLTAHTDTPFLLKATKLKLIDYLIKPLNFYQLKEALTKASEEIYVDGNYCVFFENDICYNISEKKLYKDGIEQSVTAKEIALLELLTKNKSRVVPIMEIKNSVWQDSYEATDSALKAVLNKLRKKIGKNTIRNVSGIGYQIIIK